MVSGTGGGGGSMASAAGGGQEFCLKWNNHRSTILSVMDTLLEEESLVDVTLAADGQFIRAHRVILSACSPYFRSLFKSSMVQDKHPVIVLKDVDFENLRCLVEYMYKGEANVPQLMLPSFIQTAESLQIRGLAEGASKQKLEQVAELNSLAATGVSSPMLPLSLPAGLHHHIPPHHLSHQLTPPPGFKADHHMTKLRGSSVADSSPSSGHGGGILAARLGKMDTSPVAVPMQQMFNDFHEQLAIAAARGLVAPPPMKRPRKTPLPPLTSSPIKPVAEPPSIAANGGNIITSGGAGLKQEISVKKDLLAKNSRMSPKVGNIMAPSPVVLNSSTSLSPTAATLGGGEAGGPSPNSISNNNNNNNYESDSDVLKIDEDRDNNKENKTMGMMRGEDVDDEEVEDEEDDIAELDNGLEDSEEEEAISHKELAERAGPSVGFINPWTGEEIPGIPAENDDDSMQGEGGAGGGNNSALGPVFPLLDNSLSSLSRSMELIDHHEAKHASGGGGANDANRDPLTNKYACARCGRSYLHQATLVRHQRYECGISASYPCQLCGRKFKRRDVLKGHMEKCMNKSASGGSGGMGSPVSGGGGAPTTASLLSSVAGGGGGSTVSSLLSSAGLMVGPGGNLIGSAAAVAAAAAAGGMGRSSPLVPSTVTSMVPFTGGI